MITRHNMVKTAIEKLRSKSKPKKAPTKKKEAKK